MMYGEKFSEDEDKPLVLSRASLRNFSLDGKVVNYPLYAVRCFPKLQQPFTGSGSDSTP